MSTVTINFQVDTSNLPGPAGTYGDPKYTQHFDMIVTHGDNGTPIRVPAGTAVNVGSSDRVDLALVDSSLRMEVEIAPVAVVAHRWNGAVLTPQDLADSNPEKKIDKPRFDVTHPNVPNMHYKGSETDWMQVSGSSHLYWSDGAVIKEDVTVQKETLYRPYVTFNFQGYGGTLEYGIEYAVSRDGQNIGYYYFDPQIKAG